VSGAIFLGLDLAWSTKNPSGLAALDERGAVLDARADVVADADVLAWIRANARATTVLGIDMPTIVPNATGARPCEAELRAVFGRAHAGPHPANRERPDFRDGGRARRLLDALEADGFEERLDLGPRERGRFALEVFPHPAHVRLFARETIFRYKKKQGRSWPEVWAGWAEYRAALDGLAGAEPPLTVPACIPATVTEKGRSYKRWEDLLDALTCAYVAAYVWRWGLAGPYAKVFGNRAEGYIVTPDGPAVRGAETTRPREERSSGERTPQRRDRSL
jgi:predicted RNase H-like nuclease